MFDHLLKPGEHAEQLDTRGWVVLRKLLAIDDEIIVNKCHLFDRPIRAKVEWISSNNLLKIDIQTEGAKDSYGLTWPTGFYPYHMDILFFVYKIVKGMPCKQCGGRVDPRDYEADDEICQACSDKNLAKYYDDLP